jgi:hypothetical protein
MSSRANLGSASIHGTTVRHSPPTHTTHWSQPNVSNDNAATPTQFQIVPRCSNCDRASNIAALCPGRYVLCVTKRHDGSWGLPQTDDTKTRERSAIRWAAKLHNEWMNKLIHHITLSVCLQREEKSGEYRRHGQIQWRVGSAHGKIKGTALRLLGVSRRGVYESGDAKWSYGRSLQIR